MFRNQCRLLGYLLPLAVSILCLVPLEASAQRRANDREIFVNAPPTLILSSDSPVITMCGNADASRVRLHARAQSPGGNPIQYRWSTNTGRIVGDGETVMWDLSGVGPGYYKASLEIGTGSVDGECQAFASTNVLINTCPTPVPVCPNVSVVCPTNVAIDQPITFTSNVSGGSAVANPLYTWTVSAGRIIEGQGTPSIKVDTTGLAGETIRASLSIGGFPQECSDSCEVSIPLPEVKCRKFDEFPEIPRNDVKARLDNFGIALQSDPTSTGYVIVYPGRNTKAGEAQREAARLVDYMVTSRGLDARRVVTLIGGAGRNTMQQELWVCPRGGTPPSP